jgi:peptide/nickel transport system permease protein
VSHVDATATDSGMPYPAFDEKVLAAARSVSPRKRRLKKLLRNRGAMVAVAFLVLILICALFGSLLEPYNPNAIDILHRNATPSWSHWLGTDDLGRDILSRIIAGAAIAVRVSLQSVLVALVVAVPIGLFSAYIGGTVDAVIMRFVDAALSFPALVLALAIAGVLGPSVGHAAIAISVTMLPGFIRLVRGSALQVKHETFVEASRSVGVPTRRILRKRILPNIRSPIIVAASLAFGGAILAEAGLSFLGLSVQPPDASWGNMLRRAYDFSLFTYPWQLVIPGAVIALTILAYNTLGDGLRDTLSVAEWVPARQRTRVRDRFKRRRKARRGLTTVAARSRAPMNDRVLTCADELLSVEGLSVEFASDDQRLRVVDDVSFVVRRREVLGLVGESGSGKTVTSLSIMRLLASPPGEIVSGAVYFENRDLLGLPFEEMRRLRGTSIAMVFQDPMVSLNPAYTIRDQLVEAYRLHNDVDRTAANRRALEMLELVQIPAAEQRLKDYPHQLSGGMRQRVILAMALICGPKLLIADEPTTALDVTVQAQILDLLRTLQRELDLSVIFVTHDLGVVADLCDRVAVMYAGQIMEQAPVHTLFSHPRHPYTAGLLRAMPQAGSPRDDLYVIPGVVPTAAEMPSGCRFHPRCSYAVDACVTEPVPLTPVLNGTGGSTGPGPDDPAVRCIRSDEITLPGAT